MLARALPSPSPLDVLRAEHVRVAGLEATRYRLRRDHVYTGDEDLDAALSTFGALVIPPADGRSGAPAVTLLNGITKGMDRSVPAAVALSQAGLGAVLMDTPLGGIRRPGASAHPGLAEMMRRGAALDVPFAHRLFDGVARDLPALLVLADEAHGLGQDGRRALFGVSFGCLLSSLAFARDGVGARLFGAIGHPDLPAMAGGLLNGFARFASLPPTLVASGLRLGPVADAAARRLGGEAAVGALRFARLLATLRRGGRALDGLDPVRFATDVDRPVAFLAGAEDPVAPVAAVEAAAEAFARSSVEVLPRLSHGWYPRGVPAGGRSFEQQCGAWLVRHLADWT